MWKSVRKFATMRTRGACKRVEFVTMIFSLFRCEHMEDITKETK